MSLVSKFVGALLALAVVPFSTAAAGDIAWSSEYAAALDAADTDKKVVFIAVNMDHEKANDRAAETLYHAKRIVQLSGSTINLVASNYDHSPKLCKRFGSVSCVEHKRIDIAVRENLLEPDKDGFVVAPQHVFLSPEGSVLLSVPYEVTEPELEWCFVTALRLVDPDFKWDASSEARAPRRLVMNGVYKRGNNLANQVRPVTREEALELIKEVKRGLDWKEKLDRLRRIMTSEEKEAMDFVKSQLRSSGAGGGRGGRRARGTDRRIPLLRAVGAYGAAKYWEIVEEFARNSEDRIRIEAIVALEQLAAPKSAKFIEKQLKKEKKQTLMKDWYRALGAVSSAGGKAKRTLLKAVKTEKGRVNRINAIFALGYLVESEDVQKVLFDFVDGEDVELRAVAALALGMTRNLEHKSHLEARLAELAPGATESEEADEEADEESGEKAEEASDEEEAIDIVSLRAAIAILEGGALSVLRKPARTVTQAPEPRPRLYGFAKRSKGR